MSWISQAYARVDSSRRALRRFGLQIGVLFVFLSLVAAWRHAAAGWLLASVGATVIVLAEFCPSRLRYLHRAWISFSLLLGEIVRPVCLTILFYVVLTPIGLLQRLFGRREIELAFRTGAQSYWKSRTAPPVESDYEQQF